MRTDHSVLWSLTTELVGTEAAEDLRRIAADPYLTYDQVAIFDLRLGGPSLDRLNCGSTGRYEATDRDVFRPLQYCAMYFSKGFRENDLAWSARNIVQMSGLHLESLIKRVGRLGPLPLGAALHNARVRRRVPTQTWGQMQRFASMYNAAKHDVTQPKDTHLYSVEDALLAYVICRQVGAVLYPLARLTTDFAVFDEACQRVT